MYYLCTITLHNCIIDTDGYNLYMSALSREIVNMKILTVTKSCSAETYSPEAERRYTETQS